jgi:hypothetical protein
MLLKISHRMGIPSPMRDPAFMGPYSAAVMKASFKKFVNLRYFQDMAHFASKGLIRRV